ncbi:hypothetical protein SAMN04515667_2307 [Formosa sp. Hel1_31_208]|nr:hypothetical protein [Formosa sp. Hel1_31_208]SDS49659.1 hypothetical protein SAMN04515667_2307 [Formosa sp. Hel1_31_208]
MDKTETTIAIRLTNDEKSQIQRKAHENYKTLSAYLRDLALQRE